LSHTTILPAFGELTEDRDLAESRERIDTLERENQNLLSALHSLAASPKFQTCEHSDIVDILSKVFAARSAYRYFKPSIDLLVFSIRPKSNPRASKTRATDLRTGLLSRRFRKGEATGLMNQCLRNVNVDMTIRHYGSVLQRPVLAFLVTKTSFLEL
jgi:hypothetical protein